MNTALIIIDVQNDYFPNGKCELFQPEQALAATKKLLQYFRRNKMPIYFLQHVSSKDASFFVPDTNGVQIHPALQPLPSEKIIVKHMPNSFKQTALQQTLQKAAVTELVICGMMTHMCIDTTVRAAKDLDYEITLISDACATKDLVWQDHKLSANIVQSVYMASLNKKFANVVTSTSYLENCT